MDRIPMLDLEAQNRPLADALLAASARVIASGSFILGAEVAAFETEVASALGVEQAVGMSSGSDALVAMLLACGVGPGDEVVTTPYTFFATVEAVLRVGARPVFADVDPATLNLDPTLATARIGPRTKAVLVVHLFGRLASTAGLRDACERSEVALLEDAAQAIGARDGSGTGGRSVGRLGRAAGLSFFPSKNLGGFGDGGMVLTNDREVAAAVRRLRGHGAVERFRHEVVGGNFRLDELQAALLRVKLPNLAVWTAERRRLAAVFRQRLDGLPIGFPPPDDGSVWNQYVIRVPAPHRDALVRQLDDRRISSSVFYPIPLHLQPALRVLGHRPGDFPEAERAAEEALALPIFPGLNESAIDRIVGALEDFFR